MCRLTQDCVLDPQEDPLEVAEVAPGRLEHVHDVVHAQVLDPAIVQSRAQDEELSFELALPPAGELFRGIFDLHAGVFEARQVEAGHQQLIKRKEHLIAQMCSLGGIARRPIKTKQINICGEAGRKICISLEVRLIT